ncbi:MAG TPA: hypothetical protein VFB21_00355 [Chthonomonadaceae bacterium]|nr:hypothetical protein [Chthonomonadaceae bacterium]
MKKEVGTKTVVIVLALAVLAVLWYGWQVAFRPGPGQEPPPPLSTQPKPLAPPGTYFPPGSTAEGGTGRVVVPDPANLENEMRQRRPAR